MTLLESFLNNLVAGIVASILTWIFVRYSRQIRHRICFSDYAGHYETFLDGKRIADEIVELSWAGDNLLYAKCTSSDGQWESYITMDEAVPSVGNGFFQYTTRTDYGVHQI